MKRLAFILAGLLFIALAAPAYAQSGTIVLTPDQMKWAPAPNLPPGFQVVILAGDPAKKGPYVMRVKIPPNSMIPPHMHSDTENITVISGSFGLAEAKTADKSKGKMLPAGSFYRLPAKTAHFAWTEADGAVLQVHGIGPSVLTMLKPAAQK